jgi:hypothetical protein
MWMLEKHIINEIYSINNKQCKCMKKNIYIEIRKINKLVSLLPNDEVMFYIKKGYDDYMVISHAKLINEEHKYIVSLIRQSKLYYSYI